MFGALTLKTISSFLVSLMSLVTLSSASFSPTPLPEDLLLNKRQVAIREFHDMKLRLEILKIESEFPRILKRGAQGDDVKQLQEYLSKIYPSFSSTNISGYFGSVTEKGIKQFQVDQHLNATNVFDFQTRSKLTELLASTSFASSDSSEFSGLADFLDSTENITFITPTPLPTPTPEEYIPLSELDAACLDSGYILESDIPPVPDPIIIDTCTPVDTPTLTPVTTKTPTPTPTHIKR